MLFLQSLLGRLWPLLLLPGIPLGVLIGWIHLFAEKRVKDSRKPFTEMARPAGWFLQEKMTNLQENLLLWIAAMLLAGTLCVYPAIANSQLPSMFLVIVGLSASLGIGLHCRNLMLKWIDYRLGFLGEQIVGQMLDRLSSDEFRVFHDFQVQEPGKKPWNIDHIVVLPSGVFAIETKCRRKPNSKSKQDKTHVVTFDGSRLIFPEPLKPDFSSLEQIRNNAVWLSRKISDWNGNPVPVYPVLVLPGWFVDAKSRSDVSVLSHNSLKSYFARRGEALSRDRFNAICAQLDERCRISF